MQIYTKILVGMGVGALIGLLWGPNSALLDKDTYRANDPSALGLFVNRDDPGSVIKLPAPPPGKVDRHSPVATLFRVQETIFEDRVDRVGETHHIPVWSRVTFNFSKEIAIRDRDGSIAVALGGPEIGARVEAWLHIDAIPVKGGGFAIQPEAISGFGDVLIKWLSPIGKLFMSLIMMVIVPLVFSSLLVGVAGLGDIRKLGRLGGKTLVLYLSTTAVAVTIGLVCAHLINPGRFMDETAKARLQAAFQSEAGSKLDQAMAAPSMTDHILNIVPANPVQSLAAGNMMQIIFFALVFGVALTLLKDNRAEIVINFFDRVQDAMVIVIRIVMGFAPFGVAALIAEVVGTSGSSVLISLLAYSAAVLLGLFVHANLIYGGLLMFGARMSIATFLRGARKAQLIAFSTSSSSATLPITMECAEKNFGVSKPISSFVLPLGSTVNMDGTALYQGVAALFIAQVFQMELSFGAQVGIVFTATMASIGAAGVPGAGMVTLALVLTANGIPSVGVALILGVDRLLDMFRTTINVTGDLAVAVVIAVSEGEVIGPRPAD